MIQPVVINDLGIQHALRDRREVYRLLVTHGIPVPEHITVVTDREPREGEYTWDQIEEVEDSLALKETGEVLITKPFVEKPCDAEDHAVHVYYSSNDGGGSQHLFRKSKDCSSKFIPGLTTVRRSGSFMYERFIATGGTDIKVYTVTGDYAHAEGRKSPTIDGRVLRDAGGKEIRCPILLTPLEKLIAKKIVSIFKQNVCGFDLLRDHSNSFVCDVNGWSFVKQSASYHDDSANILRHLILKQCSLGARQRTLSEGRSDGDGVGGPSPLRVVPEPIVLKTPSSPRLTGPELRCVIALIRHGERTPKQKMKWTNSHSQWLGIYAMYADSKKVGKEIKLKSRKELTDVLQVATSMLENPAHCDDEDTVDSLQQIVHVLTRWPLFGINRKVQLKPTKQDKTTGAVTELQLILKWGGELTKAGLDMSKLEGQKFREKIYEGGNGGLLRLHSTFRHDLNFFSSDEGRVQMTAAAFAKGLLGIEGSLPPILATLVRKDADAHMLLDDCSEAKRELEEVKAKLKGLMLPEQREVTDELGVPVKPEVASPSSFEATQKTEESGLPTTITQSTLNPCGIPSLANALEMLKDGNKAAMHSLRVLINDLCRTLSTICVSTPDRIMYDNEPISQMLIRWKKLAKDFFNRKKGFNVSKVPDIFDSVKYDGRHNFLNEIAPQLREIHRLVQSLATLIVPQEYGMTVKEKVSVASSITKSLRSKLIYDLKAAVGRATTNDGGRFKTEQVATRYNPQGAGFLDELVKSPERIVRSRFYVTSESHLYAMMALLRWGNYDRFFPKDRSHRSEYNRKLWETAMGQFDQLPEVGYLTQIVCRLFEDTSLPSDHPNRFYAEWLFSPGQTARSPDDREPSKVPPVVTLHSGVQLDNLEKFLTSFDDSAMAEVLEAAVMKSQPNLQ